MRYIALMLLLQLPAAYTIACSTDLECHLKKHLARGAVPAYELSKEIELVAKETGLEPVELAALVLQESSGRPYAYNPTGDHGILQINTLTAIDLGLTVKCLYSWKCNLRAGAQWFASQTRPCRYNLGKYRKLEGKYISLCIAYESRLASFHY